MSLPTFFHFRPYGPNAINRSLSVHTRLSSTQSILHKKLTSRKPNIIYDYLSPTPSHLLNISLADFIPSSCYPANFRASDLTLPRSHIDGPDECSDAGYLPQSHHLVYFSPQIPHSALLPDGTDPLQSPGPPFVRRMWAGGSVVFNTARGEQLRLDNIRAACIERIAAVSIKGNEGNEKVFVNIERRIGLADSSDYPQTDLDDEGGAYSVSDQYSMADQRLLRRYNADDSNNIGRASLVETRNIVFMREKDAATAKEDCARPPKTVRRKLSLFYH